MKSISPFSASLLCCVIGGNPSVAELKESVCPLTLNQVIEREIGLGASHSYTIQLNAADYVAGWVDQRGITVLVDIFFPDGSHLRGFPGVHEGRRDFAFISDTAGIHRIQLRAPTKAEAARAGELLLGSKLPAQPLSDRYALKLTEIMRVADRVKPAPHLLRPSSPAIEELRQQLTRGETNSEAFWVRAAKSGTPLVEPIEGDKENVLLTFLWRGKPHTRNVVVLGSFRIKAIPDNMMTHLTSSDVWYLTLRVPRTCRFSYTLSHNDPLTEAPESKLRRATAQPDPLNPRHFDSSGPGGPQRSLVELPDAPPQPWIARNADAPRGQTKNHQFKSEILKNERNISVYTPAGYRSDGLACPLLVFFDEFIYLSRGPNFIPTPVILDNLVAASRIPACVAVFISNETSDGRPSRDYEFPDFADFLATELIPWVRTNYNVTKDPQQTILCGCSWGGLGAAYAALRHPGVFGNVLCQSASFWWAPRGGPYAEPSREPGALVRAFLESPKLPVRLYLDVGTFEADFWGTGGSNLEFNRHMRDVLRAKGYEVHYQEFAGGHEYLNWRGTLADGLMALIGTKGEP